MTEIQNGNARLQDRVSDIEQSQAALAQAFNAYGERLERIEKILTELGRDVSTGQKPQWQSIFGAITLAMVIMGAVGSGYVWRIGDNGARVTTVEADVHASMTSDAMTEIRLNDIEPRVTTLEEQIRENDEYHIRELERALERATQ